jgi:hypothetical protein
MVWMSGAKGWRPVNRHARDPSRLEFALKSKDTKSALELWFRQGGEQSGMPRQPVEGISHAHGRCWSGRSTVSVRVPFCSRLLTT